MKLSVVAMFVIGVMLLSGCTDNARARAFGGNMTINLPKQSKLVSATWKDHDLYYLIRPMHSNEVAETSQFIEKSSFGIVQGTVTFIEVR